MAKTLHLHLELTVADDCDTTGLADDLFDVLVQDDHDILPADVHSVDGVTVVVNA